jgi:hypothetical protein
VSAAAGAGAGTDPLRGAIGSPAITLQGCTTGQTQVADLMSRLRAVRGVTRVALSKSEKPDAPAATTATSGVTTKACRGSLPPTFSVVVFFERSTVPATVQDVTVGTTASATSQPASSTAANGATTTPASTPAPTPNG